VPLGQAGLNGVGMPVQHRVTCQHFGPRIDSRGVGQLQLLAGRQKANHIQRYEAHQIDAFHFGGGFEFAQHLPILDGERVHLVVIGYDLGGNRFAIGFGRQPYRRTLGRAPRRCLTFDVAMHLFGSAAGIGAGAIEGAARAAAVAAFSATTASADTQCNRAKYRADSPGHAPTGRARLVAVTRRGRDMLLER